MGIKGVKITNSSRRLFIKEGLKGALPLKILSSFEGKESDSHKFINVKEGEA